MSQKEKFHNKVLSENAIYSTWLRSLDSAKLFADYMWLQIPLFDLTQLGIGLLLQILPFEFKPFAIDFIAELPSMDELMQGIWIKFKEIIYELEFPWTANWEELFKNLFKFDFLQDLLKLLKRKARYGEATFFGCYYDPVLPREYLAEAFAKLRLIRTPDISWKKVLEQIGDKININDIAIREYVNRLILLSSAQKNAFILGLSPLGTGILNGNKDEGAITPFVDYEGRYWEIKFQTLEQLQFGFILGITPLGWGILTPKQTMYYQKDGKENPEILKLVENKTRGVINRLPYLSWAYSNYNKPREMLNYHESEKTSQYDILQKQRRVIEEWVYNNLPEGERNALLVREYQNAILQYIAWKSKRHKWGFKPFADTDEEKYKEWWVAHWVGQGLKEDVLNKLYDGIKTLIPSLRENKVNLGETVKLSRKRLAFSY
ncbi:MAG: hypothetical protein QXY65_02910 [Candidatus Methanomethylicaceae archaeon]